MWRINLETDLLRKLGDRKISKEELLQKAKQDFGLLPELLQGTLSPKATIRYSCAKVLVDLSEEAPEKLYPYVDKFIELLDNKHRILTWNALAIIANLAKVDGDKKFDAIFERYYSFLNDEYMVTVANVVANSAKIALAKPNLVHKIVTELMKVNRISLTPHLTEECKRVLTEHTIRSFDLFFEKIEAKDKTRVFSFVEQQLHSPRLSLRKEAETFLKKWK